MVKKIGLVAGAVLLLMGLVFGRDTFSYVGTSLGWVRQTVRDNIPVDVEINRARDMVKNLEPEIHQNMHLIAREEVGLKNLKEEITKSERQLAKNKSEMERLTSDLKRGDSTYSYNGVMYTSKQVENDLTRRFDLFKDRETHLDQLKKIVGAREERLAAANEKLRAMRSAKEQLLVDIEHLEARLEMVKVAQTTSALNFDDSRLARTKDLIKSIGTRIDVAEKLVSTTSSGGHIALDEPEDNNIVERVSEYFDKAKQSDSSVVVKLD